VRTAVIEGLSRGLGARLAAAGDVDGDGFPDLLVAAGGCGTCEGAFLLFGGPTGPDAGAAVQLAEPADSHLDFGQDLDGAGDLDGDGYADLAVGSWASGVYVYHGGPEGPDPEPWVHLGGMLDWIVAGAGDLNGDGYDDLAVGDAEEAGEIRLYPGSATGLHPASGVSIAQRCDGDLSGLGDLDGDGFAELLTASNQRDYLVHGAAALPGEVQQLNPAVEAHSYEIAALGGPGDIDGDGFLDLATSRRGSGVSVYTGGAEGYSQEPTFTLEDALPSGDYGVALDLGGDLDGDGLSELVVGAGWQWTQGGGAVLYTGDPAGPGAGSTVVFSDPGENALGAAVCFPGDLDGDGFDDLAIGSPGEARVYLYYGGGDQDGDGWVWPRDCDDGEPGANPDGVEVCDGLDNDCDGVTDGADAEGATAWYRDADGDGWPAPDQETWACAPPEGYRAGGPPWDCDDFDAGIHPGAEEIAGDAVDQDCDGADPGGDSDPPDTGGEEEPPDCGCRAGPARASLGLLPAVLLLAARRRAWPLLALLAGCTDPPDDPEDTGPAGGGPLSTLFAAPDGAVWLGGAHGRVARWSPGTGLVEEPAVQPGWDVPSFLTFQGAFWAVHDGTASRYDPAGWRPSGLDAGETGGWGYEGSLLGVVATSEDLAAFTALPPDLDPDCYFGCSTTWDLYLQRWDGGSWVRVQHVRTDGKAGPVGALGTELLLGHGATLWRWDGGALSEIAHPLGNLRRIVGTPDGALLVQDNNGALALGDLAGLSALEGPEGGPVDAVEAAAADALYALADGRAFAGDGQGWSAIPDDCEPAVALAPGAGGTLFALGTEGGHALCAGDATGLAVVWRED
jgi:hypothetical protein